MLFSFLLDCVHHTRHAVIYRRPVPPVDENSNSKCPAISPCQCLRLCMFVQRFDIDDTQPPEIYLEEEDDDSDSREMEMPDMEMPNTLENRER